MVVFFEVPIIAAVVGVFVAIVVVAVDVGETVVFLFFFYMC